MRESWDNYQEMITEISQRPRSRPKDSKLGLNKRIIGSPLPKAPTGMFTKRLTELNVERPYWRPISLLGRCWRSLNITTGVHRVRPPAATEDIRYRGWCTKLCTRVRRAETRLNIHGINDHLMRSLRDRYEVIYGCPSPMDMIPRAEATIHSVMSSPLHPCWQSANDYRCSVQSSTMITDGLGMRNCSQGIRTARVLAHLEVQWVWPVTGMLTS